VEAMVGAGFEEVFLGIETPSAAALAETGKKQNLRMPAAQAVEVLTRAGLEVFAGFIVGFDAEEPDIFDRQLELISALPVPRAMAGLLVALPGTRLWRRLQAEGRLRGASDGDNFERPNFRPAMDERRLLTGYRRLAAALYAPSAYYHRCTLAVDQLPLRPQPAAGPGRETLAALLRVLWGLGVVSPRRLHFWRLVAHALRRGAASLPRALALAVVGESLIEYTSEVLLPRLDRTLAALEQPARGVPLMGRSPAAAPGHAL